MFAKNYPTGAFHERLLVPGGFKSTSSLGGNVIILIPQFSLKTTSNSVKREDLTAPEPSN
jgi:hypothetical protein